MRIGGGGSSDINVLQSDAGQWRNEDFVVSQALAFAGHGNKGAVAAKLSYVGLWNPAASGVVLVVDRIKISSDTSGWLRIGLLDSVLADLSGAWANLLAGGAAGAGLIYTEDNAATQGVNIGSAFVTSSLPVDFVFPYPVQLVEGEGIIGWHASVNLFVTCSFYGREI